MDRATHYHTGSTFDLRSGAATILELCRAFMLPVFVAACAAAPGATSSARQAGNVASAGRVAVAAVREVAAVGMTVSDMDRALAFYSGLLSFEKTSDTIVSGTAFTRLTGIAGARARVVRMRLGDETIELTQFLVPGSRPVPADSRSNDRWFQHIAIVVSDMDRAYAVLRAAGVRHVSPAPQLLPAWNPNAGGISAFYFNDPDGHALEVIHFPPGKGLAKWQRPSRSLFLGIDHTAIVIRDTEASLAFYRGVLGMRVAGASENYGPEQERLNNVAGAHLRITALRADQGPGIEFLEYLAPEDGRPYPADARPIDLLHWQTTVVVGDAAAAAAALRTAGRQLISSGPVDLPGGFSFTRGLLARDPDGHALQIVER
jgi:catechol 2,3-dioxygenase-like lactoylglutathione lyase family enzyme